MLLCFWRNIIRFYRTYNNAAGWNVLISSISYGSDTHCSDCQSSWPHESACSYTLVFGILRKLYCKRLLSSHAKLAWIMLTQRSLRVCDQEWFHTEQTLKSVHELDSHLFSNRIWSEIISPRPWQSLDVGTNICMRHIDKNTLNQE